MSIFRVKKERNYTVMSNRHLQDRRLSLKSTGLLSLMLSLPDDWEYTVAGLTKICRDGSDSIKAALKELETLGYLERKQSRERGKLGKMVYDVYEHPKDEMVCPADVPDMDADEPKPALDYAQQGDVDSDAAAESVAVDEIRVLPMSALFSKTPSAGSPSADFPPAVNAPQVKTNISKPNISITYQAIERKKESNAHARDAYAAYPRKSYDEIIDDYFNREDAKRLFRAFLQRMCRNGQYLTNVELITKLEKLQCVSLHSEEKAVSVMQHTLAKGWTDFFAGSDSPGVSVSESERKRDRFCESVSTYWLTRETAPSAQGKMMWFDRPEQKRAVGCA